MNRPSLLFLLILTSLFVISMAAKEALLPKSSGPPACFAGEPPRNSTCQNSGCHTDFPLNSGAAILQMDLGGAESGYALGQVYTVQISLTVPGLARGGFQAIALQDNNDTVSPGTYTLVEALRTQRIDQNFPHADTGCSIYNRVWIEHTELGIDDPVNDTISWRFLWQAPSQDVGTITFYAASVEADGDLDATGDHVYSISQTIAALPTSLQPSAAIPFQLYPQPASDELHLDFPGIVPSPNDQMAVYDLAGRRLMETPLARSLSTAALPSGYYLLKVRLGDRNWVKRFARQ